MASEIEIVNLALAHLGDKATVSSLSPPEGSAQAEHGARFYPQARDVLLEKHNWRFATKRVSMADASLVTDVPSSWTYAYALPSSFIRMISVLPPEGGDDSETQPYEIEMSTGGAGVVYTNQEDAVARYIYRVTDTTKFSPLFVDALSWLLASYLAGPVLKGQTGMTAAKACFTQYLNSFFFAAASDAQQRKVEPTHTAAWISAR
jgi:hypothetical protein